MNSTGLYDAFRSDVVDTARPYFWTDDDVWRYAADAHRMFLRLTGGVSDFISEACEVPVVAGEAVVELLEDDFIDLQIYRLPLNVIDGPNQEIEDIEEDHHIHLIDWMKHLAYKKQDADTYNPQASALGAQDFEKYCAMVKAERARYMYKVGTVGYGGL